MYFGPTMLPTARISKEGKGLVLASSASDGPPFMKSAQVNVLAGIWMIVLHGTWMTVLLTVTVPPKRAGAVVCGHLALSESTVASWMNPVTSKPWILSRVAPKTDGVGRVGVTKGDTAPLGGLAVPPPFAFATPPASANTARLRSATLATILARRRLGVFSSCMCSSHIAGRRECRALLSQGEGPLGTSRNAREVSQN